MMVDRRKPLILSSTRCLLESVRNSETKARDGGGGVEQKKLELFQKSTTAAAAAAGSSLYLRLPAGILRWVNEQTQVRNSKEAASFDDSTLVGLSASVLKRLSITSGSLVLVRNSGTRAQKIARVVVLDSPDVVVQEGSCTRTHVARAMAVFPSYTFPPSQNLPVHEAVYLSPLLAFNLDLHVSCLKSLVHGGQDTLMSLFKVQKYDTNEKETEACIVDVELTPWSHLPRYASHLRASFIKIPGCGTIESLKGSSVIEADDRQEMIDSVLHEYFKVDRYLSRGDVFCIRINWNCKSEMCIRCSHKSFEDSRNNIIYFKVMAMEPLDEPILRVNCNQTALVLGGSVPAAVPPDSLVDDSKVIAPLHGDTEDSSVCTRTTSMSFRTFFKIQSWCTVVRFGRLRISITC